MEIQDKSFLNPLQVKDQFGIKEGMKIADFGSGSGEFSLMAGEEVGENGLITAIDVRESALSALESKAKLAGLSNIELVRADLETEKGSGLNDGSQDMVFLINILFQVPAPDNVVIEANRVLKQGGILIVIDWKKSAGGFGPPDNLRKDEETMKKMITKGGFVFSHIFDAGSFHSGYYFTKN